MKKTVVFLSIVILASANAASAGVTALPPPAYPQGTYQAQPAYQNPAGCVSPPVVYAPAPVVYYPPPPVVYYTPPPVYYAPAPVSCGGYGGGYGCDPLFGFVSLIFNYGGDDHYYGNGNRHGHHGNGGDYYRSNKGGRYNHRGNGGSYYRSNNNGGSGHRNNNGNYYRAVKSNGSGHRSTKNGNYRAGR